MHVVFFSLKAEEKEKWNNFKFVLPFQYNNSKQYGAFRPILTIAKPRKTSKHAITPHAEHMNSKILNITEAAQRKIKK